MFSLPRSCYCSHIMANAKPQLAQKQVHPGRHGRHQGSNRYGLPTCGITIQLASGCLHVKQSVDLAWVSHSCFAFPSALCCNGVQVLRHMLTQGRMGLEWVGRFQEKCSVATDMDHIQAVFVHMHFAQRKTDAANRSSSSS